MNMIEVDPKLFVKCRLCLDETGQYQIVPNVQMQIKYCFDIDVEPFDGLPQLVCKKCESILSQYAGIKQIFQEKQKNLKTKLSSNAKIDSIVQQQQDTVSSTQAETENKKAETTQFNRITPVPTNFSSESESSICSRRKKTTKSKHLKRTWQSTYTKFFVCRYCAKTFKNTQDINRHIHKQCKLYKKYSQKKKPFCLVGLKKIDSKPNITGSKENVVCDRSRIIQSSKSSYYVLYTNKSQITKQNDSSESSDEDFFVNKKKIKRRRLISRSSTETVVIEPNTAKSSDDEKEVADRKAKKDQNLQIDSDIECVNIDSDSNSTKDSVKTKDCDPETSLTEKKGSINDKMVNNIIAMCFSKYMNRLNATEGGNPTTVKEDSSLKHKVLSIGRKVICNKGTNTTGLLRYMEYKNLEVVWVPRLDAKVIIKTRSKEGRDSDNSNFGWENISSLPNHNYVSKDFALDFEKNSELEDQHSDEDITLNPQSQRILTEKEQAGSSVIYLSNLKETGNSSNCDPASEVSTQIGKLDKKGSDNVHLRAALESEKNWTKLLNANPVANPKQLPKKNTFNEPASIVKVFSNELQNGSEITEQPKTDQGNDLLHMPIITSTVSLAPVDKVQANVDCSNQNSFEINNDKSKAQSTMPKIKVKPASELMSEKALSQQKNAFVSTTGWPVNNEQVQNVLQTNDTNMVYMSSGPFANVIPMQQNILYFPQRQNIEAAEINPVLNQLASKQLSQKQGFVVLHTIELPNTRTDSPFRYFQKLLQMHNIHLLDSEHVISTSMNCLVRFKVVFEQETNSPVQLCLLLYCGNNNIFCIKARDDNLKDLGISQFSANWQWEILKMFKGDDIVPRLHTNAMKLSPTLFNYTSYFTNLLKSIVFTKES